MDNFEGTIVYSALCYLLFIFLSRNDNKIKFWDYVTIIFSPISLPIMVFYCFIKVVFE